MTEFQEQAASKDLKKPAEAATTTNGPAKISRQISSKDGKSTNNAEPKVKAIINR